MRAAILGAVYFALAPRYYDSKAKLLIVQRNQDQVASVGDQPALDNTMATQREIVVSPVVIQEAIEQLLPEHRIDFAGHAAVGMESRARQGLSATPRARRTSSKCSYRSRSPEAASAVVSAVIQSYLQFVDRTHKGSAGEAIAVLTHKSDQVKRDLDAAKASCKLPRPRRQPGGEDRRRHHRADDSARLAAQRRVDGGQASSG